MHSHALRALARAAVFPGPSQEPEPAFSATASGKLTGKASCSPPLFLLILEAIELSLSRATEFSPISQPKARHLSETSAFRSHSEVQLPLLRIAASLHSILVNLGEKLSFEYPDPKFSFSPLYFSAPSLP